MSKQIRCYDSSMRRWPESFLLWARQNMEHLLRKAQGFFFNERTLKYPMKCFPEIKDLALSLGHHF